jgi:hypothetical protein
MNESNLQATTLIVGEEGTTHVIGEEGSSFLLGEEASTDAFGEENPTYSENSAALQGDMRRRGGPFGTY